MYPQVSLGGFQQDHSFAKLFELFIKWEVSFDKGLTSDVNIKLIDFQYIMDPKIHNNLFKIQEIRKCRHTQ